jgi:antitoxin component YwqK of YwqJK toxin-antitoxin module
MTEEKFDELCYMCYDDETNESLMDPSPCKCKGSIKIHKSCLNVVRMNTTKCGICKSEYFIEHEIKEYYDNGSIKCIKCIVDGKLEGLVKQFSLNYRFNYLASTENYISGKREGLSVYYDTGKNIICKTIYANDIPKTIYRYHKIVNRVTGLEENVLHVEENIINGKLNGFVRHYYPNNAVKNEITYVNDVIHGTVSEFYCPRNHTDRYLKSLTNYDNGKKIDYKEYHTNGKLKSEKFYDSQEKIHGLVKTYYNSVIDGEEVVESEINYKHGVLHGTFKEYYIDGSLKTDFKYVNGTEDGTIKKYFQNNIVSYEATYEYGKLENTVKTYHENGILASEAKYLRGIPCGIHKKYSNDGTIISQINHEKTFLKEVL